MHLFRFLLLIFPFSLSYGQDYIPMLDEVNEWNVVLDIGYGLNSGLATIGDEAVFDGRTYKGVYINESDTAFCYLREEAGVVYRLNDDMTTERVFLDFTLEIGDTVVLPNDNDGTCLTPVSPAVGELLVYNTQTEFIAGADRKVIYFQYIERWSEIPWPIGGYEEVLIEGIGSTGYFGYRGFDLDNYYDLACFTRDGTTYFFNDYSQCEFLNVEEFERAQIKLYPNPLKSSSTLFIPEHLNAQKIEFYSLEGVLMHTDQLKSEAHSIQREQFKSGVYIYRISTASGTIYSGKLVVH